MSQYAILVTPLEVERTSGVVYEETGRDDFRKRDAVEQYERPANRFISIFGAWTCYSSDKVVFYLIVHRIGPCQAVDEIATMVHR